MEKLWKSLTGMWVTFYYFKSFNNLQYNLYGFPSGINYILTLTILPICMQSLEFNKIYVIESLFPEDAKTGTMLYDDIIRRKIDQKKLDIDHQLINLNNRQEFFQAFDLIKQEVIYNLVNPYIHFEIHRSLEGFILNSNELVEWKELAFRLPEINLLTKNNTFLSLSTCYGGHIYKVIDPSFWAPFWGYIGPMQEVFEDQTMAGFHEYFNELLESLDFVSAIKMLNQENVLPVPFYFCNTEHIFNKVYDIYESKYLTEEYVTIRLASGLIEARKYNETKKLTDAEIKNMLRYFMVDQKDFLKERLMNHFFMYDFYPELKNN